jgi:hypothetical protein
MHNEKEAQGRKEACPTPSVLENSRSIQTEKQQIYQVSQIPVLFHATSYPS